MKLVIAADLIIQVQKADTDRKQLDFRYHEYERDGKRDCEYRGIDFFCCTKKHGELDRKSVV